MKRLLQKLENHTRAHENAIYWGNEKEEDYHYNKIQEYKGKIIQKFNNINK